ncbi:TPA: hypothetical protein ACG6RF_002034 [Streptococcus agalactiae]
MRELKKSLFQIENRLYDYDNKMGKTEWYDYHEETYLAIKDMFKTRFGQLQEAQNFLTER